MMDIEFIQGDARKLPIPDESVQCIVTSPPYWGLRKYSGEQEVEWEEGKFIFGLEPTIEMYVAHTLEILREMWRVLRSDGVAFWNIGDTYASGAGKVGDHPGGGPQGKRRAGRGIHTPENSGAKHQRVVEGMGPMTQPNRMPQTGLKPKDLCLIPSRVALAAQQDGWWVRSMIVWAKSNPMPESCRDRPTKAYEHVIMFTKAERYFWNFEAVQEPTTGNAHARGDGVNPKARGKVNMPFGWETGPLAHTSVAKFNKGQRDPAMYRVKQNPSFSGSVNELVERRNMRNVWQFPTQPYSEAHFATFPEELPRRCILAATRPGDTVLDPFAGSGTVGKVAIELNRKAILNDLAYHALSEKRAKNVQRNLLLDA